MSLGVSWGELCFAFAFAFVLVLLLLLLLLCLCHLQPAVNRQLSFVSPFVCSSASCSSCSDALRIFCCLFCVIYVLSLSGLRFVVSLYVLVLPLSSYSSSRRLLVVFSSLLVVFSSLLVVFSSSSLLFSSLLFSSLFFSSLLFSSFVLSSPCPCLLLQSSWRSCGVIFGRLEGVLGSFLGVLRGVVFTSSCLCLRVVSSSLCLALFLVLSSSLSCRVFFYSFWEVVLGILAGLGASWESLG